ncbi:hypothetical protein [Vibrio taketomensis]|uniref:hypothetical protein n=1 Tax=Vibrio taketomensis TaxID=2572923 RepID=UPI001E2BF906|nr:hypothetical protein [Vibrio taketomensis]
MLLSKIHWKVGKYDGQQQVGYSGVMQSLAKLGRSDIALNSIQMDANNLDIRGMARDPHHSKLG